MLDRDEFVPRPRKRGARDIEEGEYVFFRSAGYRWPVFVRELRGGSASVQFIIGGDCWIVSRSKLER